MDQELNKGANLGAVLIAIVASLTIIITIYGTVRSTSIGYIDALGEVLISSNVAELNELSNYTTPITRDGFLGIVERNGKMITSCKIYTKTSTTTYTQSAGTLTIPKLKTLLKNTYKTTYNMKIVPSGDGTYTITVWAK